MLQITDDLIRGVVQEILGQMNGRVPSAAPAPAASNRWGVFEDLAREGHFVETFLLDSWLEHLRQHERVTNADRIVQDAAQQFHIDGIPKVTHLLGAVRDPA